MLSIRVWVIGGLFWTATIASSYAQPYDVPFRAEHFDEGDLKVYWARAKHSDSGVQEHGYDLAAVRYDSQAKKWTELAVSDAEYNTNKTNQRWLLYGKYIHAMRDGKVIACWRNAPENPPGGLHPKVNEGFVYGGGNGFWIEHADGTRVEYAHMIPGSVPSNLCPHNDALLPKKIASPAVGNAWPQIRVPADKQVAVKQGQFLGRVGNAGTSSNPHLHIHVEQGGTATDVKSGGTPVKINFRRGLSAPRDHGNPNPDWKSFAGKPIPPGPVLVWPPRSLVAEYARHGFPAGAFQDLFDHLADSGYWPVWIDTYNVGGGNYINHVWRPATAAWRAHFLVSGQTHQTNTNAAIADGFSPVLVESSVSSGQARYTAVFVKGKPSDMIMRHGLTVQQHDAELAAAKKRNLYPVNISVISIGGERRYTVLYRPENVGSWLVRSQIPEAGYQAEYNDNTQAGRKPIYLNAYMHGGQPFISAIFASKPTGPRKDRHLMSPQAYQNEWASALNAGMLTHTVTSFDGAQSQHRFAASWWR